MPNGVPIIGEGGSVAYGAAVPFQTADYTEAIMRNIQMGMAADRKAQQEALEEKKKREAQIKKYKNEVNKMIWTADKGIMYYQQDDLKTQAAAIFTRMREQRAINPYYEPDDDDVVNKELISLKSNIDEWQQEKTLVNNLMLTSLDQKKMELYNFNTEFLDAIGKGADKKEVMRMLREGKGGLGKDTPELDRYYGVGGMSPVNITNWEKITTDAAQNAVPPTISFKNKDGTITKIKKWTPEAMEKAADTFMMGEGGRMSRIATVQGQAHDPLFSEEKATKTIRDLYMTRLPSVQDIKGAGGLQITVDKGRLSSKDIYFNITKDGNAVFGVPGATSLPANIFKDAGKFYVGKPTGEITNKGTIENPNLDMLMKVYVPKPDFLAGMTLEAFVEKYPPEENPSYYKKAEEERYFQLTGNSFNTEKWRGEYGFDNTKTADQAYLEGVESMSEKPVQFKIPKAEFIYIVVINPQGKKVRIKESEKTRALSEGYKLVK